MPWEPDPLSRIVVTGSLTANEFTIDFVVPSSPVGSHLTAAGWLNVKGGQRPFPEETRSALDIEGKHVTIQGPSPI
jgi:hypothetical protein